MPKEFACAWFSVSPSLLKVALLFTMKVQLKYLVNMARHPGIFNLDSDDDMPEPDQLRQEISVLKDII